MNKVDICNKALTLIDGDYILSLDEDSQNARLCNEFFDSSLQTLLQEHPWNFALKRAALARLTETPAYEYTYAYGLPSDCLRVVSYENQDQGYSFKVEGNAVLTDVDTCKITYIFNVEDMNKLSPMFRQAFIFYMAAELAPWVTNAAQFSSGAAQQYASAFKKAKAANARESRVVKGSSGSWTSARYLGSSRRNLWDA